MGTYTISMVIFNSYVELPEGTENKIATDWDGVRYYAWWWDIYSGGVIMVIWKMVGDERFRSSTAEIASTLFMLEMVI